MYMLALMLSLDGRHPDIEGFSTIKRDLTQVTGANISVKIMQEFLDTMYRDDSFILRFPVEMEFTEEDEYFLDGLPYNKLIPFKDGSVKKIKARELWDTIVESNWLSAEPKQISGFYKRHLNAGKAKVEILCQSAGKLN